MKIFSVILLLFTSFFTAIGEKYALIIAVGDYPEEGHWPDISSQNDLNHVKYTLLRLGFSESNIATISDTQATRQGIINALILLRDKISTDDQVYIHFSGHGQQVVDQNGDEIDRLDEAIVPYDSPLDYVEGVYEGQNLIRDEELGAFIDEMRRKIGSNGQIILVLDSCHSGTGTRGMGKARGTFKIMGKLQGQSNIHTLENTESTESAEGLNMAPLAAFFGSSPRELNYETKDDQGLPVGSLTFALTSVISELNSEASFEEVFQRVKQKMSYLAPRQNPQFEGIGDLLFLESGKSAHSNEGKVIALHTN
ncbi:MAG: caspase family protein, partial [Saprospiraceae bacterium]|nr:caspase family protein [Saprospiraceae bacterium]